jgi:hypothetical protein
VHQHHCKREKCRALFFCSCGTPMNLVRCPRCRKREDKPQPVFADDAFGGNGRRVGRQRARARRPGKPHEIVPEPGAGLNDDEPLVPVKEKP